jgi:hypothetical protein
VTPEEKALWARAAAALMGPWRSVELTVDGYQLTLEVRMLDPLRFAIMPFVDGKFSGKWLVEDCEERRRFIRPSTRHLYSAKDQRSLARAYGKKEAAERFGKTLTHYYWHWQSFGELKRHLLKHNKDVRIVKIGGEVIEHASV